MVQNGAKAVGGIRYLPVGSKPTARMGVLGADGEPDIKPLGQKKAALMKDAERKAKLEEGAGRGFSDLKTKAEFDAYISSNMTKSDFDKLKKRILDSRKQENDDIFREQSKLEKKAQDELAREGIETYKGDIYASQGNSYIRVAYGVYASRSAKSTTGKSVYDYVDSYRKEQNKLDKRADKQTESLSPFEAYIIRPGITYNWVTGM